MTDDKRMNPIARRTRALIMDALLELMREHPFKDITIKEIMYQAKLVRRTFYGHFSTKEEVLDAYLEEIFVDYMRKVATFEQMDTSILAETLFEFCLEHQDYLLLLKKNNMFIPIEQLEHYLYLVTSSLNLEVMPTLRGEHGEYATAYFAGGFLNIISHWVDEGMQRSPQEMGKVCVQLLGEIPPHIEA